MDSRILDRWDAVHAWVHRRRWWIRLAVGVILVPWFLQYAYTRMTTLPAAPSALTAWSTVPSPDPAAALAAAIAAIPPPPPLPAPPQAPPGKHWEPTEHARNVTLPLPSIDCLHALTGPWSPDTRYHLRAIIDYLEMPAVQATLAEVDRHTVATVLPADYGYVAPFFSQFRATVRLLCVQGRYHMAQKHDPAAAATDARRVLDLCAMLENDGSLIRHLVGMGCRELVYGEIMDWSREFPLTQEQTQPLLAVLRLHPFDMPARWRTAYRVECLFALRMIDSAYTRAADGNGWFVPYPRLTDDPAARALSLLNVLSPLMNDRLTVTRKIQFAVDRSSMAADLPFPRMVDLLGGVPTPRQSPSIELVNPTDGLFGMGLASTNARPYILFVRTADAEAAAIASLGLSAYKTQHGCYPARLADLVPDYLPSLPIDVVTGGPLCYRLDDRDGYSLYSPGEDGIDNGGPLRDAQGKPLDWGQRPDWTFVSLGRDDYGPEWYLVPDELGGEGAASQPQ